MSHDTLKTIGWILGVLTALVIRLALVAVKAALGLLVLYAALRMVGVIE